MNRTLFTLLIILFISQINTQEEGDYQSTDEEGRITEHETTDEDDKFPPFLGAIYAYQEIGPLIFELKPICVAAILSETHIVTSASCILEYVKKELMMKFFTSDILNSYNTSNSNLGKNIDSVAYMLNYESESKLYDVVLVNLAESIAFKKGIRSIDLPVKYEKSRYLNKMVQYAGLKRQKTGKYEPILTKIKVVDKDRCEKIKGKYSKNNKSGYHYLHHICTENPPKGHCFDISGVLYEITDSGNHVLLALESKNANKYCGVENNVMHFTKLAPYRNWINTRRGINESDEEVKLNFEQKMKNLSQKPLEI